mgnify:CR=1 FL=1
MVTLRFLHYPTVGASPESDSTARGQAGAGTHTDYGNVTLLATDDVAGLQVCTCDGSWIYAPSIAGAFICNIGDCLMRWANDVYVHATSCLAAAARAVFDCVFSGPESGCAGVCHSILRAAGGITALCADRRCRLFARALCGYLRPIGGVVAEANKRSAPSFGSPRGAILCPATYPPDNVAQPRCGASINGRMCQPTSASTTGTPIADITGLAKISDNEKRLSNTNTGLPMGRATYPV